MRDELCGKLPVHKVVVPLGLAGSKRGLVALVALEEEGLLPAVATCLELVCDFGLLCHRVVFVFCFVFVLLKLFEETIAVNCTHTNFAFKNVYLREKVLHALKHSYVRRFLCLPAFCIYNYFYLLIYYTEVEEAPLALLFVLALLNSSMNFSLWRRSMVPTEGLSARALQSKTL